MKTILIWIIALTLTSCAPLASTGSGPQLSGFLDSNYQLSSTSGKYPFKKVWQSTNEFRAPETQALIYIAPVDTEHLRTSAWWHKTESSTREAFTNDIEKLAEYTRNAFTKQIEKSGAYRLVSEDQKANALVLELALVELVPTDVYRKVLSTALSPILPIAGAVSLGSQGSVGIEGKLSDGRTGEWIFMFADKETGKLAPFSLNDFTYLSHARDIVDDWAEQFAEILQTPEGTKVAEKLPFTLLPI